MIEDKNGGWSLAEDYKSRRIYVYGDAKTIKNMAKFVRDMQDCKVSFSDANLQSEVFLEALNTCVKDLLGNWHTGLNSLSTISNLYHVGFLD